VGLHSELKSQIGISHADHSPTRYRVVVLTVSNRNPHLRHKSQGFGWERFESFVVSVRASSYCRGSSSFILRISRHFKNSSRYPPPRVEITDDSVSKLLDNEFNNSHPSFLKMGSMIPQLNPHALWKPHLAFKNPSYIGANLRFS